MATKVKKTENIEAQLQDLKMNVMWQENTQEKSFEIAPKKRGRKSKSEKAVILQEDISTEQIIIENFVPDNLPVFYESENPTFLKFAEDFEVVDNTKEITKKKETKKTNVSKSEDDEIIKNTKVKKFVTKKTKAKTTKKVVNKSSRSRKINFKNLGSKIVSPFVNFKFEPSNRFITALVAVFMVTVLSLTSYAAYNSITLSNQDIIKKAGEHVILPMSETPKVYIVKSESNEIFSNPLFAGVKVGDNVLNYEASGRVVIYRSSEDKVVNIINTK